MTGPESTVHEALLWEHDEKGVRCTTCERRCRLAPGQAGWCGTRVNREGVLYTLTYGLIASLSANPIEKKPLYHFYPGTLALTTGAWSCNFDCPWCQNWRISKRRPHLDRLEAEVAGERVILPGEFVRMALECDCQGVSVSLNEPTLSLEWTLDTFPLAKAAGLYTTLITNGYMSDLALQSLIEAGLDAMNVDVKGDAAAVRQYCGADAEAVWRNCRRAQQGGVWVEVTTLVVPTVNDAPAMLHEIAARIARELGPDTPWHVTRYYPDYRFTAPQTPIRALDRARMIGFDAGLRYVYVGNVRGHPGQDTCCPGCGAVVVDRDALQARRVRLQGDRCTACGARIAGRF